MGWPPMSGAEVRADGLGGGFRLDTMAGGRSRDAFERAWETHIGDGFPLPAASPALAGDYRVRVRAARVQDAAVVDVRALSALGTASRPGGIEDRVRLWLVEHGSWSVGGQSDPGQRTVSAGQFLLRHVGRSSHYQTEPRTRATIVVLPAAVLTPLLGNQFVTGTTGAAEARLLAAHANAVQRTALDLGPAGAQAAYSTLIELAKAVAQGRFDDVEPLLAPSLAQAAKDVAERRLADPELSPALLARELRVSVRSLQRAFGATGEPAAAYIRRRRLEEARLALTSPSGRLSITELAAYWQFADSSHFTRAFKKHFGQTPAEYARSARPGDPGRRPYK